MEKISFQIKWLCLLLIFAAGCSHVEGNVGKISGFEYSDIEAEWIRNGEPIMFEKELWFPEDGVDILRDAEVILVGEYRGVQFFVERVDVRPYNRLYTKFARTKFRSFIRRSQHD